MDSMDHALNRRVYSLEKLHRRMQYDAREYRRQLIEMLLWANQRGVRSDAIQKLRKKQLPITEDFSD